MEDVDAQQPLQEDLYGRYCAYTEASRAALLKACVSLETRRSIAAEEPCLSRIEFEQTLESMGRLEREEFVRRIDLGYENSFEKTRSILLDRYLRSLTGFKRG